MGKEFSPYFTMKSFKKFLKEDKNMAANTDAADINEIMMAYYLAGQKWSKVDDSKSAQSQLKQKKSKVNVELDLQKTQQAEIQAQEVLSWAKKKGYKGSIKRVWWTARPGVLAKAVGQDVDSRKNPTDVLVQFTDGKFLGISAKATKSKGDIGFKNPGIGTIDKALKIDLKKMVDKEEQKVVDKLALPDSKSVRKKFIREPKNSKLKEKADAYGSDILSKIRDMLYKKLNSMSQDDLRKYVLSDWLDASNAVYPPYIKVTGMGNKPPYKAKVEDPLSNDKISLLSSQKITLEKVGNDSVGIKAGGKRILKMRSKYESQKIASSIKFSGDPWK